MSAKILTTQEKIFEIKRLMEEVITEVDSKAVELMQTKNTNANFSSLAKMLATGVIEYKAFLYNHWEHGDDKLILRLNQYDDKEKLK